MDLPHDKQFHFNDGTAIGSLDALAHYLEHIGYEEFYRHVNAEKNDFANWVRHVLKEERLAKDLDKVSSIVETVEILNDYLHPRVPEASHEDMQSKIEEEQGIEPPMDVKEVPAAKVDMPVAEPEEQDLPELEPEVPEEPAAEPGPADFKELEEAVAAVDKEIPVAEEKRTSLTDHDRKMLIVKDFLWGFFFGIIVGVILGKMISII